ncbi:MULTISPECIES: hypothetical protein [Pseudomonas]|uniref:Uncharacterized protein n=1 Tax=Pseudomonas peradeniyensis TaxID=2745488 RepID=A0ABT2VDK9_9PSED|nr:MULTISPECIES: hypothetical protein [Pseudomonas]MCU7239693.1 hypothetical protein [Pseudomonas peradeniyensis]MCU7282197.1 hypothetical protein [Pseudomonas peradeniyensis]QZA52312.1 hypothetical protein K2O50_14855 [Pseudomonas sp. 2hn]
MPRWEFSDSITVLGAMGSQENIADIKNFNGHVTSTLIWSISTNNPALYTFME